MPIEYISTEDAISAQGIRMTVVSATPSAWGEAAKGIFHVKGLPWKAVRYNMMDKTQSDWIGFENAPSVVFNDEAAINGWLNILNFAENQTDIPSLVPDGSRELCLRLSDDFCGTDGLGWHRRLMAVHAGLTGKGGFALPIAQYLGLKYGYSEDRMDHAYARMISLLTEFVSRLKSQEASGSPYYIGECLTCVDIYSACFMGFFDPLPEAHCPMHPKTRAVFKGRYLETDHAFDPILLKHRDYIYETYLELPLSL